MSRDKHSLKEQAAYRTRKVVKFGINRKAAKLHGKICSMGTARNVRSAIVQFLKYLNQHADVTPRNVDVTVASNYLRFRSERVCQNTLNLDRQAISIVFHLSLPNVKSTKISVSKSRAYMPEQVKLVASHQTPMHKIATEICHFAGLRAHELATLARANEQPRSANRNWSKNQFSGMGEVVTYTVRGKGGLVREIALSPQLAERLEKLRLLSPITIHDREIYYFKRYDIGCGQAWSQSFCIASKVALGWSNGGHGLRHSYAQRRMRALLMNGFSFDAVLGIVSSEMGHFRSEITRVYLR